ncbi:hypothetical protein SMTE5_14660 [Serratia marcescens]|nr:hypothetical protein SMTE5_14660 [Serratia marcescens]
MKQLPLRDVMRNLGLTVTKDGYELSNPAGTARYDFHGVRTTASGIPEYFPITLSVKVGYVPVVEDFGLNPPKAVDTIVTDATGAGTIASCTLTYCQAVLWIDPLLAALDKANIQLLASLPELFQRLRLRMARFLSTTDWSLTRTPMSTAFSNWAEFI